MSLKDKVPPHDSDAEQATLGALLLDWDAVGNVIALLRPERFYDPKNQKIFEAILALYNDGVRGDLLTLQDKLRQTGQLDAAGGVAYITSLTDTVPTSANVEYYAQIVFDNFIRRELIKVSSEIVQEAHDDTIESRAALEEAQKRIFDLTDSKQTHGIKTMHDEVPLALDIIKKLVKDKSDLNGIPSGLVDLDVLTSGFHPSELIIIGARPSIGKTALAMSMAEFTAVTKNIPTAFFSLEMSDTQLMMRLLAQVSRISSQSIKTGRLNMANLQQLQDAAGRIYDAPLYIVDTPNMKLLDLRAMARRFVLQYGVKIIFIDYITLIQSENTLIPRHEQIAEISRSLKSLARELLVPVVVLSQVKRDAEQRAPNLADLRESGSIEQDADVIMFLHRERETSKDGGKAPDSIETQLILAKQRNGPIGTVDLVYLPSYTKFENKARES